MKIFRHSPRIALTLWVTSAALLSGCGRTVPTSPETIAPRVVSVTPAPNAQGIATNTRLTVTFSEPVDPSTVTILIDGLPRGPLSFADSVVTLTLRNRLFRKVPYVAVVPAGVADLAGNRMEADYAWPFTTGFAPLGEAWTTQTSPSTSDLHAVAQGATGFLAVGSTGTMLLSAEGTNWSALGSALVAFDLSSAFPINDRWLVAGSPGALLASTGPNLWTTDDLAGSVSTLTDIWVGYDGIYMVGTSNAAPSSGVVVKYVSEGNWTVSDLGPERIPRSITRYDGGWVIVGDSGLVYTSADGVTWDDHSLNPSLGSLTKVRWDGRSRVLVAVGSSIFTSTDGHDWIARTPRYSSLLRDIAWTDLDVFGTRYVLYCAVGDFGRVLTSETLLDWKVQNAGIGSDLLAVAAGHVPARFVAVGKGGVILTSE